MMHPVATTNIAPTDGGLPSQAAPVVGIDIEQLDLSTRQAAAYLFPKERGLLLLQLLFLQAEIQTLEIDGVGQVDVAIIHLQSIEAFARAHPGWGKDTTLRYIALLEALQILQRHRHAEYTEVHVPLIPWSPSEAALAALDDLLVKDAAREKLQQLAVGVKARFFLLYGSPHSWPSLFDDLDGTLTDIQEVLNNRAGRTKRQLLQLRVTNLKARLAAKKGDFHHGQGPRNGQGNTEKGDFYSEQDAYKKHGDAEKGDFHHGQGTHNRHGDAEKGDFRTGSSQMNGRGLARKGDFQQGPRNLNSSSTTQKGDFQQVQQGINGHALAEKGDFQDDVSSGLTRKGDFQRQSAATLTRKGDFQIVALPASLNDNVITIYNDISQKDDVSDNDAVASTDAQDHHYSSGDAAKVGRQLAMFLEKSPQNTGGFVNKCKQCPPIVIRAAVIDVLVHAAFPQIDPADERGRPKNRASWFHDACKKYAKPGTRIPGFIEKWLRTDLSWEEIEQQLNEAVAHYQRFMIADSGSADLVRKFLRGEIEEAALEEALMQYSPKETAFPHQAASAASQQQPVTFKAVSTSGTMEKTWMDEEEALTLAKEILRDAGPYGVSKAVAKQVHGVYVVALVWRGGPMDMKTPQQWRTHFANVRPHFDEMQRKEENHGTSK